MRHNCPYTGYSFRLLRLTIKWKIHERTDDRQQRVHRPNIYTFYLLVYVYKDISYVQNFVIDLVHRTTFPIPVRESKKF